MTLGNVCDRGGAKVRRYDADHMVCACGDTMSCADPSMRCNCDINDVTWRLDEGDLTNKNDLPVTMFAAGDTGVYASFIPPPVGIL